MELSGNTGAARHRAQTAISGLAFSPSSGPPACPAKARAAYTTDPRGKGRVADPLGSQRGDATFRACPRRPSRKQRTPCDALDHDASRWHHSIGPAGHVTRVSKYRRGPPNQNYQRDKKNIESKYIYIFFFNPNSPFFAETVTRVP